MRRGIHAGFMRFQLTVVRWVIVVFCLWLHASRADDRIWVQAKINGKPARLCLDTGAAGPILHGKAVAQRFGLKFTPPKTDASIPPGKIPVGRTETCTLSLWGTNFRVQFRVTELAEPLQKELDGVIGWNYIINNELLQIDAAGHRVAFLSRLPKNITTWTKLPLYTNSGSLQLELSLGGKSNEILVDTGDPVGVALHPDNWLEWKASHPKQPLTLRAAFMPDSGLMAKEEAWADKLVLGPLVLNGVPVTEAGPSEVLDSPQFAAALGMAGLRRLDLIVDSKHGVAYLRSKTTQPPAYNHNRLGAVFMPADLQSHTLVAHVVDGSPAYEAGVRNGDVLVNLDDHSRPDSRAHSSPIDPFWRRTGTKLDFTLKRGKSTIKATAILRDILAPEHTKP
jgi:hypothetical protein